MRFLIKLTLIILSLTFLSCQKLEKEFTVTDYVNGIEYRKKTKVIIDSANIDLKFIRKHFYVPYNLPEKFIDFKYKNEEIVIWRDDERIKDFKDNWTNTFKYNYQSQITEYSYSGCMICSDMPYNYIVTYDEIGRVIKLENTISTKEKFEFKYNSNGQIKKLNLYTSDNKLDQIIELN